MNMGFSEDKSNAGFTLLELVAVAALVLAMATVALPLVKSVARIQRVDTALEIVKMQLRLGKQFSITQRKIHRVTFSSPRSVTLERLQGSDGPWVEISTIDLGGEVEFRLEAGVVASGPEAPDRFNTTSPINFNGSNVVLFRPDGSAVDESGGVCNGVVHMAWPGFVGSARAATLFGGTGRIKGWRYVSHQDGGWSWE